MLKWVIIVTFASSGVNSKDPIEYTRTEYARRTFTQAVVDSQGRTVLFDSKPTCDKIAQQVIDKMISDPAVIPISGKCIQATVEDKR